MLKGSINKNLEVCVTLSIEDLEQLEREKSIKGIMARPVVQPQSHEEDDEECLYGRNCISMQRGKGKKTECSGLKPNECLFTAHMREMFRFEGLPANHHYWNRKTYDLALSRENLQHLRQGQSIVKREPNVPVDYICVSLEKAVPKAAQPVPPLPSQTQSL
ncbi:MAG: hypothetical protein QXM31_04585 [Candidatus Woesearchaeota archaeon]